MLKFIIYLLINLLKLLKIYSLISKHVYYITTDNLYVNLFFFRLKNKKNKKNKKSLSSLFNLNSQNLEILSANLSNFISKKMLLK